MGRHKTAAPCSIDGCESPKIKNGYCNAHNLRFRRYGDPLAPRKRAKKCSSVEESKARRKAAQRAHYLKHRDLYITRSRLWKEKSPEAVIARRSEYKPSPEVIERAKATRKAWRERNIEYERQRKIEYKAANKARVRHHQATRRASIIKAKPPWLTKDQKRQIVEIYAEAVRLSEETGVQHHVDHIVPLRGGTVCGLHVPWNLRAIPADVNQRRPRFWRGEERDGENTGLATLRGEKPEGRPKREGPRFIQSSEPW